MRTLIIINVLYFLLSFSGLAFGAENHYTSVPKTVAPHGQYLFYLHGAWLETKDINQPDKRYGKYQYYEIVNELADSGYFVISELRDAPVRPMKYAKKIAQQVNKLLLKGAQPENITVIGHSKGGQIALMASTFIKNTSVKYIIMAGCGKTGGNNRKVYEKFLKKSANGLSGKILSIYDVSDTETQTCKEAFEKADQAETKEIQFTTHKGHGLFFYPDSIWIEEVKKWSPPK